MDPLSTHDFRPRCHLDEQRQEPDRQEEIFERLFHSYSRPIATFFKNRGFSNEECRDLTQETFLCVHRGLPTFRQDSSLETWVFSIARNLWSNALRNQSRLKRKALVIRLDEPPVADKSASDPAETSVREERPDPLARVLVDERLRLLRDALVKLPPLQRRLVLMRFERELKYREIAASLKIPEGTVKSQLSKARGHLKGLLEDHYANIEA